MRTQAGEQCACQRMQTASTVQGGIRQRKILLMLHDPAQIYLGAGILQTEEMGVAVSLLDEQQCIHNGEVIQ